jgi:peptidoglycan/xylan/chitin deacetylase (PgdA/CDA1 family)
MKKICFFLVWSLACLFTQAQNTQPWKGKKCAVVLTYDDALNVHLDNAIPLLDSLQLKGTFYLSAYFPGCSKRLNDWRKAGAKGHELANHTLFHPCIGDRPGREFVQPDYKMNHYTVKRMVDETRMTNVFLEALDGKKKRTFAFTCGDMKIGDTSFIDQLKNDFVAARTVYPAIPAIDQVDVYALPCYGINGQTGEELVALVNQAMQKNGLLVFLFHGVGGEHSLNVSLDAHRQLLQYLKQHEKEVWVTTALDAAENINQYHSTKK